MVRNKKLYRQIVNDAKEKFKVWPSAYASGWVVRRYKELGGTYKKDANANKEKPLSRWYKQEWINGCQLPKVVPCGRPKASIDGTYPYCRPRKRITKDTPKTADELSAQEIKKRCAKKKHDPSIKIK